MCFLDDEEYLGGNQERLHFGADTCPLLDVHIYLKTQDFDLLTIGYTYHVSVFVLPSKELLEASIFPQKNYDNVAIYSIEHYPFLMSVLTIDNLNKLVFDILWELTGTKPAETKNLIVKNVQWINQYNSVMNGKACHWCKNTAKCCNGGTSCSNCTPQKCKYNSCCYAACLYIIEKKDVRTDRSQAIDIVGLKNDKKWKEFADLMSNPTNFNIGVQYLDNALSTDKPVVVGVHYENRKDTTYNKNKATFHYIVVVAKIVINGKVYYRFIDPGRGTVGDGANEQNLLEVNLTSYMITGLYQDKIYTITEIRKNIKK